MLDFLWWIDLWGSPFHIFVYPLVRSGIKLASDLPLEQAVRQLAPSDVFWRWKPKCWVRLGDGQQSEHIDKHRKIINNHDIWYIMIRFFFQSSGTTKITIKLQEFQVHDTKDINDFVSPGPPRLQLRSLGTSTPASHTPTATAPLAMVCSRTCLDSTQRPGGSSVVQVKQLLFWDGESEKLRHMMILPIYVSRFIPM